LRNKGNAMTYKTKLRDSTDIPHSRPIRQGSALYRALEIVAAEIVRKLPANRAGNETPNPGRVAENNGKEADID
jgi:hypothetical protein